MRRTGFGCLWSLLFWILALIAGNAAISSIQGEKAAEEWTQNGVYGWSIFVASIFLGVTGSITGTLPGTSSLRRCPYCSEMIKPQAKICRYCRQTIEPDTQQE